ncbi:MAG: metallophosphoesterase [Myxococcales bacterium]
MSVPRLIAFLTVFLAVVGGLHYYVWARLVRDPALPGLWARVLTALLLGLALAMPISMIGSRFFPGPQMRALTWVVFIWMGVGFLFAALLFAADSARVLARAAAFIAGRLSGEGSPPDPARRLLLTRAIAGGVGIGVAGLSGLGLRSALGAVQVKEVLVRVRNLPAALAGMKVVQISDVHIGPLLRKEWLERVVARIRSLSPDLVAITGDLVDGSVAQLADQVQPLAGLQAPRGVYFVTGNHEYYSGVSEWLAHLPSLGIRPLVNERLEVAPGLDLAGIPDPTAESLGPPHAPDLPRALAGRDPERPLILLAHQPRQFPEAASHKVALTLSGHTHGGQIWPFGLLVGLAQPYVAGLHRRGDSQIYVSRGTGFWGPPLRVFAPAEITLLRLHPA